MKAFVHINGLWFQCVSTMRGGVTHIITVHRVHGQGDAAMAREVRKTVTPVEQQEIRQSIDWEALHATTDEEIDRAIDDDPDASPLTPAQGMALRLQAIRKRMGLSQSQFAERFQIPVATLRDWEQARRQPDAAVWAYIQVIDREPDAVLRALRAA